MFAARPLGRRLLKGAPRARANGICTLGYVCYTLDAGIIPRWILVTGWWWDFSNKRPFGFDTIEGVVDLLMDRD